jgi:CYTH domain-containing protein
VGCAAGKYARYELERRFLLEHVPDEAEAGQGHLIVDLYLPETNLRLRRVEGSEPEYKLSKKKTPAPPDYATTTITTLYLSRDEYELLRTLPGRELRKRRHHLGRYSIDVFEGKLAGLILAEIAFASDAELRAHATPDFAVRDVSDDVRYTGGSLATLGLPR